MWRYYLGCTKGYFTLNAWERLHCYSILSTLFHFQMLMVTIWIDFPPHKYVLWNTGLEGKDLYGGMEGNEAKATGEKNTGTGGPLPYALGQCVVHPAGWFTQGHDDIIKVCFGVTTPGSVGRISSSNDECKMVSRGAYEKGSPNACPAIWWLLPAVKWESIWDTGWALPRVSQLFSLSEKLTSALWYVTAIAQGPFSHMCVWSGGTAV